ncbi:hypothetical protein ACFZ8E_10165 [Methylobacterium sp. HMF5984]|uniref:hypothetical protein n=1 Tax=Methylobacterium sp. HMF5984 TaxID=3367370 RepID=UPI00385184F2
MVAIVVAAVFGAGLSILLLAKFGLLMALLAIPLGGSTAGMAAAIGLAAARDRRPPNRIGRRPAMARPATIVR